MSCLELDDSEALKIADPMVDTIVAGLLRRDYAEHSRHFSILLKSRITPEKFLESSDRLEDQWGSPGERELFAIFRKTKSFTLVWHQHFDRSDDQVAAVVTIALKGGRYFVDGFHLV